MKRLLLFLFCWALLAAPRAGALTPVILSPPQSITVNNASDAQFTVEATNAVSYQWQFNGSNLTGETNATLSLDDVTNSEAGDYTVIVTSTNNISVTSSPPAVLTIVPGTIVQFRLSTFPDGRGSNITVQLFDHDKPATVENFIHYITSGDFSNTFFYRCVPGFVLQGGYEVATDRTSNSLDYNPIGTGPNFPSQVDSEFNVGPLIHNQFGTLAMALVSGEPNSATSGFFFNLADNSANLDNQNGGFTVFGRAVSGSNVLQYFNTLSSPSNGLYEEVLPVNYDGTNAPVNANLFFCDFTFETPPPVDTVPPTIAVASPAPNTVFSNSYLLTTQGTAQDNVGLAEVFVVLTSLTGPSAQASETNAATGTTNWSLFTLLSGPGIYRVTAFAQDGAGNLSAPATLYLTNLAQLTIITNLNGEFTTNASQYLLPGQEYSFTPTAEPGEQFYSWTVNGTTSLNPVQTITANENFTLTVQYIPTNLTAGLAISSPVSGQQALSVQSVFTVTGTLPSTNITQLTCQFYVNSNSVSEPEPAVLDGTNWSLSVTNFANGAYSVAATATDAAGGVFLATSSFTLLNVDELNLNLFPAEAGSVSGYKGQFVPPGVYPLKADPAAGYVFYSWSDGNTTTLDPSTTVNLSSNTTLTATFVPENPALAGITFTYPPANARLTTNSFNMEGTLPAALTFTQMTCQLFIQSNGVTASPQTATLDGRKWTLPVTNLTPGPYRAMAVAYDSKGRGRLIAENFELLAQLNVQAEPPGAGSVTASAYLEPGKAYLVSAKPKKGQVFAYWTGAVLNSNSATTAIVLTSNTLITAHFTSNLFAAVAGAYTGLFLYPEVVTPTNSGLITLTTTSAGVFDGVMMFPFHTIEIFPTQFLYNGSAFLLTEWVDSNILSLSLALDLTNGADTITGFITDHDSAGNLLWADNLILYRNQSSVGATTPPAGKYAVLLQPENGTVPPACGYAAISLGANGALALGGTLPDNTAISESTRISKDGIWPFYCVPSGYGGKGMIIGWQTNTASGTSSGQLFWCKPGMGVAASLTSTGAVFAPPSAGDKYALNAAGGLSSTLSVSKAGQFAAAAPVKALSLLPTGVVSGQIKVNNNNLPFKGIFISPTLGGGGFILDDGTNNGFQISPQP